MEAQKIQEYIVEEPKKKQKALGFAKGLFLTIFLAVLAGQIANLPFFSILGIMILSILLGGIWGNTLSVPADAHSGVQFSSKVLLRAGIILLGFRLNLQEIISAGLSIMIIDVVVIVFTMSFILLLGKVFKINKKLSVLLAAGTAICGAAAIIAIAPIVKSKEEQTAVAVSCIAVLGTVGAILYIVLFPILPISEQEYGVLAGATLHEIAHVVAAGVPGGEVSSDSAILVKLGRVLLLIPVALIISFVYSRKNSGKNRNIGKLPIPWFIFGFLLTSLINTIFSIPGSIISIFLLLSTYLLAMGMAGLGLNIKWKDFVKVGYKPVAVAIVGFLGLLAITPLLLLLYKIF
ncbi:membrane protein [Sporosarcina globispora]|uniref:Membrane protein n=1 Tax=Sporosarcina globispora TaxID=1459 RepID=A0A0M0GE87_SPOGL|nr:putative sulfate exporter family transporter [Sporosarcina globispora]KON87812.1 membrane protein [Sporosarcina globispora]